ncbi:retrovirus-related pol polyprotein from transposon TNT 1-94 [Tanacetum coccineum]
MLLIKPMNGCLLTLIVDELNSAKIASMAYLSRMAQMRHPLSFEKHRLESRTFEVKMNQVLSENERLLAQAIDTDIVKTVVNLSVNACGETVTECQKCLELETELIKKKDFVDKDKLMITFAQVRLSTSASGSQPSGNTKKDRILQTPSSNSKNKVEAPPRNVKSSLNKRNGTVKVTGSASVQKSKKQDDSDSVCVNSNDCMSSDNVFTWVKCLRSKDEAPAFIINFLKMIQVRLKETVRRIRTDNGTEFVNQTLREYYEKVGISHETSVANRSPQQTVFVEERNRTLIEASRTISGLVPNPSPSTPFVPPSRSDWDLLFQPMFDVACPNIFEPKNLQRTLPQACRIEAMAKELQNLNFWRKGIDFEESFAPVARLEAIRIFLAFLQHLRTFSMLSNGCEDFFLLNGNVAEKKFMWPTDGFVDPRQNPNHVYKLKKALMGETSSTCVWIPPIWRIQTDEDKERSKAVEPSTLSRHVLGPKPKEHLNAVKRSSYLKGTVQNGAFGNPRILPVALNSICRMRITAGCQHTCVVLLAVYNFG